MILTLLYFVLYILTGIDILYLPIIDKIPGVLLLVIALGFDFFLLSMCRNENSIVSKVIKWLTPAPKGRAFSRDVQEMFDRYSPYRNSERRKSREQEIRDELRAFNSATMFNSDYEQIVRRLDNIKKNNDKINRRK